MNRRLIVVGAAAAAVVGAVVPSFASQGSPVTVQESTTNGVAVGVFVQGQPAVGAHVTPDGSACVGLSYQIPVCTSGGALGPSTDTVPLPVTIRHDDQETAVGVGKVGVIVSDDGTVCPVVSTQDWQCVSVGTVVR